MIFRFFVLLAAVILVWWGMSAVARRYSLNRNQSRWLLIFSMGLTAIVTLIAMGRLPVQFILAPIGVGLTFLLRLLPTLLRLLPMWQMLKNSSTFRGRRSHASVNQKSTIRTEFVEMVLAHSTGDMDGEVIKGHFAGRKLSGMNLQEILQFGVECRIDQDSMQVLEAYLDRMHAGWRDNNTWQEGPAGSAEEPAMSYQLALEVLGLTEGVTRDEVVKAHRKLMQKMHPDRGGTEYLAKKINAARDYLVDYL